MTEGAPSQSRASFLAHLARAGIPEGVAARACSYWELLVQGNERQNLTRLTAPADFFSGFLWDVLELRRAREQWGLLGSGPLTDLGSGAGVPGLLSAAIFEDENWILVDSEGRKVEFLRHATTSLGLEDRVSAVHGRVESLGAGSFGRTVTSKAVGKVEKLYGWLRERSTWNTLVLLKGPRWEEEWGEFTRSKYRHELAVRATHEYRAPAEGAKRVIIHLERVPRGTHSGPKRS